MRKLPHTRRIKRPFSKWNEALRGIRERLVMVSTRYEQLNHARQASALSQEYGLPFTLCLTLGTNRSIYEEFIARLNTGFNKRLPDEVINILIDASVISKKYALNSILGYKLAEELHLFERSSKAINRLADYVVGANLIISLT